MKKTNFLKTVFTILMCGFFSITYAGTIYLSATGNDSNDGLTTGTAVASFSKAQTLAADGDTIMVSGMIDFTVDPANTFTPVNPAGSFSTSNKAGIVLAKNLTIQGASNATDGFMGTNLTSFNTTRFIQIITDLNLTLKNVRLVNGEYNTDLTTVAAGGGAITMLTGSLVAENVIFDSNVVNGWTGITGGALYVGNTNANGLAFKNCIFNANTAQKSGAIYINSWGANSTVKFENCALTNNVATTQFGGSALYIRANANANTTLNMVNCTVKGNIVTAATNGGAIYFGAKSPSTTNVNIVNCTITENTNGGTATNGAGVYFLNSTTGGCWGNLYIINSIIEGNKTSAGAPSDLCVGAISPTTAGGGSSTVPGYIKIQNSIVGGVPTAVANVPAATNIVDSPSYGYLSASSILPDDYKAKLDAFDTTTNSYALLAGSPAIDYGKTSFLTSLVPSVTTDQLGKTRPSTLCSAGSVEKNAVLGLKKNLDNSILVYRNANNQITVENTKSDFTGAITVYNTLGQIVAKKLVTGAITTIDKPLNSGVYIVMLNNVAGSSSKKVIIN